MQCWCRVTSHTSYQRARMCPGMMSGSGAMAETVLCRHSTWRALSALLSIPQPMLFSSHMPWLHPHNWPRLPPCTPRSACCHSFKALPIDLDVGVDLYMSLHTCLKHDPFACTLLALCNTSPFFTTVSIPILKIAKLVHLCPQASIICCSCQMDRCHTAEIKSHDVYSGFSLISLWLQCDTATHPGPCCSVCTCTSSSPATDFATTHLSLLLCCS